MKTLRAVFVLLAGLVAVSLAAAGQLPADLPRIEKREIAVMGAVGREGKQTLPAESGTDQTLIAAITRAGGFTRYAEIREVRVVRRNAKGEFEQSFTVDASEQLKGGKAFGLQPGDIVHVHERD